MTSADSRSGICKDSKKDKIWLPCLHTEGAKCPLSVPSIPIGIDSTHPYLSPAAIPKFQHQNQLPCSRARRKAGVSFSNQCQQLARLMSTVPRYLRKLGFKVSPETIRTQQNQKLDHPHAGGGRGAAGNTGGPQQADRPASTKNSSNFVTDQKLADNFGVVLGVLEHT